mgnify:CR=1 FL=1
MKIESASAYARGVLDIQEAFGSFDAFVWQFVDGRPKQNAWESRACTAALERRGFRFVGPTTFYAFMQAVGLVNDHVTSCFRYSELSPE